MGLLDNIKNFAGDVQQSVLKVGGDLQQGVIEAGGNAQQAVLTLGGGGPITALTDAYKDNLNVIKDTAVNVAGDWQQNAVKLGGDVQQDILNRVDVVKQAAKESVQPIWERQTTKDILGEDGAKDLEKTLNPINWPENSGLVPEGTTETVKKYLPAVALGGLALLVITALK